MKNQTRQVVKSTKQIQLSSLHSHNELYISLWDLEFEVSNDKIFKTIILVSTELM